MPSQMIIRSLESLGEERDPAKREQLLRSGLTKMIKWFTLAANIILQKKVALPKQTLNYMNKHQSELQQLGDDRVDLDTKRRLILKPGGGGFLGGVLIRSLLRWDGQKTIRHFGPRKPRARKPRAQRPKAKKARKPKTPKTPKTPTRTPTPPRTPSRSVTPMGSPFTPRMPTPLRVPPTSPLSPVLSRFQPLAPPTPPSPLLSRFQPLVRSRQAELQRSLRRHVKQAKQMKNVDPADALDAIDYLSRRGLIHHAKNPNHWTNLDPAAQQAFQDMTYIYK